MKPRNQTYNDGVASIYTVGNIAEPGNMPKDGLTFKVGPLRYEERKVGITRFWTAKQFDVKIDMIIRTPKNLAVFTEDIAVLPAGQFQIKQVQYPEEEKYSMDLSLERVGKNYEIAAVT